MAENETLIPVIIPPLATLLAHAEATKSSRLTEPEVVRIRDEAQAIMLPPAMAERMAESRGYRDVEPENCWADWHRLRVQLTGNGCLPRIVFCVLGGADLVSKAQPILEAEGIEHDWLERDERMVPAFKASASRYDTSLEAEDLASIAGHAKLLYVLSKNFTAQEGPVISRSFLRLSRRLLEAGGLALKCESSGIAHGRSRWLELARKTEGDDFCSALLHAYVQMPISNGDDYYTCGMHLLGMPDLIVSDTLLREAYGSTKNHGYTAVNLFGTFALYLLAECPDGQFKSGDTFATDAESPSFRVMWENCTGYDEDDLFFNPFGRWRFAKVLQ
jgi:hypothetical protein